MFDSRKMLTKDAALQQAMMSMSDIHLPNSINKFIVNLM